MSGADHATRGEPPVNVLPSVPNGPADKDLLFRESMVRRLQSLRRELGAPGADPLEKLLIERIVAAWLQVQQADLAEASKLGEDDSKTAH